MRRIGAENAILDMYPNIADVPTYHRGSNPIDGIFVSASIAVNNAGYLPFGVFPSDHRGMWIDISFHTIFGHNMPRLYRHNVRRLQSDNPRAAKKFRQEYKKIIRQHSIHTRLFDLEKHIGSSLTTTQQCEYEDILKIRYDGIRYANKRCRKIHMGGVPFSDKVGIAEKTIELWKAIITRKLGKKFSSNKIRRLQKLTGIGKALSYTLEEANKNLDTAFKEYWSLKKNARNLRKTFISELADARALELNQDSATILRQMYTWKTQRHASISVKNALLQFNGGGVTKVVINDENGAEIEVTTKTGIEKECIKENERKFLQTANTPCMTTPLVQELGYMGSTEACKKILDGTYIVPDGSHEFAQEFFDQFKTPDNIIGRSCHTITSQNFKDGWKKMKEKTTSGISGLHFGHMKTCAKDLFIVQVESAISHIPFHTGYTPRAWRKGVNVMIHKKNKSDKVTDLRTIVLTEADFNFNNKILGKRTLEQAETYNALAKEQYGSRKGKSAIDHAIHKRLTYDIIRLFKRPGAL